MRAKYVGLLVGLIVGVVWMSLGFTKLLFVILAGAVGYIVGRVLEGDVDLQRIIDDLRRK